MRSFQGQTIINTKKNKLTKNHPDGKNEPTLKDITPEDPTRGDDSYLQPASLPSNLHVIITVCHYYLWLLPLITAIKHSCNDHYLWPTFIMIFLMILMIISIIALTRVVAEFWRPDVDRDEAKPRVFDGLPVFPLHLSQNSGRSVPHHSHHSPFLFFFHSQRHLLSTLHCFVLLLRQICWERGQNNNNKNSVTINGTRSLANNLLNNCHNFINQINFNLFLLKLWTMKDFFDFELLFLTLK